MGEQQLIDANDFPAKRINPDDCLCGRMYAFGWNGVVHLIDEAPTIDPETLTIVQQLRAELERVTAERNAAIKDIEAAMGSESTQNILKYLCSLCQNKDLTRGCTCDGKCAPKWRGAQKEE